MVQRYAEQAGLGGVDTQALRSFVGAEFVCRHGLTKAQQVLGHKWIAMTAQQYVGEEGKGGLTDGLY